MHKKILRSPLFFVGDKHKLMKQLLKLFPKEINNFYEPFLGGGSVFLNVSAKKYYLNDIDKNYIRLHKYLITNSKNPKRFFNRVGKIIDEYQLSKSYKEDIIPASLKKEWKKTYFAKYNYNGYLKLREYYNNSKRKNPLVLYILLIYGFNRMLRFNKLGNFNLPVGNVDFNNNVVTALNDYFDFIDNKKIDIKNIDYRIFFNNIKFRKNDFVYLDPPYLITSSEYNKLWNVEEEKCLLDLLDELNKKEVNFALSNVTHYNGSKNELLINWMKKYNYYLIKSNYISYHDNKKKRIKEYLITNY